MKNRFLKISAIILSAVFAMGNMTAYAQSDNSSVGKAADLADVIVDFKLSQTDSGSVQDWIDGALTENAGLSSEWYVFALSRFGDYDFSLYEKALLTYLGKNQIRSASSRLKYALVLASVGSNDEYITETMNNSIGEQGVMSWIYGLHMLNNGYESDTVTADEAVSTLLTLQKADGGWAIMGENGETDATAMAVQALAPRYNENESVKNAVDEALGLLSEKQLDSGDFSSYGVANPESTGQVLIALTSLGIDPLTDERFIKNENTLIDGMGLYRNQDGSFSHESGKDFNETATVQTFYSLVAYLRFSDGETPLFMLDSNNAESPTDETTETPVTEKNNPAETTPEETTADAEAQQDYKPVVCIVIAGAAAAAIIVLIVLRKGKKQNIIAVCVVAAAAALFVTFTDFSAPEDYYGSVTEKKNPVGTVTLSIRCDTVAGKSDKDYIPVDGVILSDTFVVEENETVFDILTQAAKEHSIHLDYSGTADSVYISGINYLYEFDFGDLSGWMYRVNGEKPSVGCDRYILSDGDSIEWLYSCEMGNDL